MVGPTSITEQNLRRSVRRIAPYRPFGSGEIEVEYARRQFVLAAAHENGGRFASLTDCQQVCKALWGLDLELDEVHAVMRQLLSARLICEDGAEWKLTETSSQDLAERVRTSNEVEATAFAEWELTVHKISPLHSEQLSYLREDLTAWIQRIITRLGIEAALLLYPEEERYKQLLNDIKALGFGFLPERDPIVMMVRPEALDAFIDQPTMAQRTFLDNLLTTAYLMSVFTLDPAAHEIVRQLTHRQRIYLDTNVVYSILTLNGPKAFVSVKRVLQLSRQLGYEICVTPWTVAEMQESVRNARKKLARTQLSPRAVALLTANATDDVFITAYRRTHKETGVTPDDFLDLHEQIEPLLEKEGIRVDSTSCIAIDQSKGKVAEQIGLLESVRGGTDKPRPLQEHDVKHRLLVERLRGEGNRRFSNAGYWFLTNDSVLIPYAAANRQRPDEIPFAVSLAGWAHIVRSLCPRTDDYDQTMVDLLGTPSVRPSGVINRATVTEAIGRIDTFTVHSNEEIATRVLLDTAVTSRFEDHDGSERDTTEDEQTTVEEQLRELKEQVAKEREARMAIEVAVKTELESERQARIAAEQRIARLGQPQDVDRWMKEDPAKGEAAMATEDTQASAEWAKLILLITRITRWTVAILIALAGVATLTVPLGTKWITAGWPLAGDICGSGAILAGAFAWLYGRKRASALITGIGVVLGIVVAVQAIVS